jgi:hypothetical protein
VRYIAGPSQSWCDRRRDSSTIMSLITHDDSWTTPTTSSSYSSINSLLHEPRETKHDTEYETEQHRATLKAIRSLYVEDDTKHKTRRASIAPPSSFPLPPTLARLQPTTTTTATTATKPEYLQRSLTTNQWVSQEVDVTPLLSETHRLRRMREWLREANDSIRKENILEKSIRPSIASVPRTTMTLDEGKELFGLTRSETCFF